MNTLPTPPQPSQVTERAEHDPSEDQRPLAGERSGDGADALRPYLEQDRKDRFALTSRGKLL
jgi:hypothetical protein